MEKRTTVKETEQKTLPYVKVMQEKDGVTVHVNGTCADMMYLTAILIRRISELAGIPAPAIAKIVGNSLEKTEKDADDIISLLKALFGGRK